MSDCECLPVCPFFNDKMANMPVTAEIVKKRFCKSDNTNCARHKVMLALGRENVPLTLYPNQVEIAEMIIAQAKAAASKE